MAICKGGVKGLTEKIKRTMQDLNKQLKAR